MKKFLFVISMLGFFIFLSANQDEIKEKVEVINIEVPLRVMDKGKAVGGLKKNDFLIYENGKLQHIHGFNEYKRKIQVTDTTLNVHLKKVLYKPRLFVLVFNLTDYLLRMDRGINYLFERILRKNDQLMVLVNNTFIPERIIKNLQYEKDILKSIVKKESKVARVRLLKIFRDIEMQLQLAKNELEFGGTGRSKVQVIASYLDKYLSYFIYYKKSYLIPDVDKYYAFAKYLEMVKMEKWVINFYQLERFPKLKPDGRFRKRIERELGWSNTGRGRVSKLLHRIDRELGIADDFPVEQISKLFLRVNTTFHSIFMKPINPDFSEDIEYYEINTDIENSLRQITKMTGGALILSNNLEKSLDIISEKEDIFYILTYEPLDKQKKNRKIKVKVKSKSYKVIYDKTVYADFFKVYLDKKKKEIPEIKIENLEYKNRMVSFTVSNFRTEKMEKENLGKVEIKIKIVDKNSTVVFDRSKILLLKKKNRLSVGLDELKKGDYYILLNVKDLLTEKTISEQKRISF